MNRAIQYVLNNKEGLMEFTNDAIIPHDNTSCERSIRPFVVIRNRCKFSVSVHGAQASAIMYSLVISCIENKQNPYMYFTYLSIPWWRSHPIHENRATESIWTEPCNPLLRATKSTKRATSIYEITLIFYLIFE